MITKLFYFDLIEKFFSNFKQILSKNYIISGSGSAKSGSEKQKLFKKCRFHIPDSKCYKLCYINKIMLFFEFQNGRISTPEPPPLGMPLITLFHHLFCFACIKYAKR